MREKQLLRGRNTGANLKFALFIFLLLFTVSDLFAQRIASVSGNWHDIATWGGAAVPTAAESVTINSGITLTINATGAACSSISFASNSVHSFLNISGAFTLSVSGDIVFSDPSQDNRNQTFAIGTGIVSCANLTFANTSATTRDNIVTISTGSLTVSGTIAMPGLSTANALTCSGNSIINLGGNFTGTGTFTASTSTLTLNGTGSQSIRGAPFYNVVINKASGVTTFVGSTVATGRLTLTSGNLDLDGATTFGSLVGSSTITSNGAANRLLTIGTDNTNTSFSGIIKNGTRVISLTKSGTGTLTLSGANTYTGATSITGIVKIAAANVLPDLTALTLAGTLDLNGFSETIGSLAGAGTVTSTAAGAISFNTGGNNSATTTFTGLIQDGSGTLSLTKSGSGIMILSGLNSYKGSTIVSAGTLTLGAAGNGTNSPLGTIAGGTTVNSGAVLNLNGKTLSTDEPLALNGTGILSAGALINGLAGSSADYTGLITLESASSIVVTSATGSLNITNPGTITGAGFGLTLGGAGIGTLSSIIGTGTGTLTKIGAGTWTLSTAHTFSGGTTLSGGILNINHAQALGTVAGTFTITAGTINNTSGSSITTLNYPMAWNGNYTFTGTNDLNLGTGSVSLGASVIATITANNLTVGGIVSGSTFNLTKAGIGTFSFGTNDVTINSLTISAGTLVSTSGVLSLKGIFSNNATFSHNNGTLAFTGTIAQTIGGTVVSQVFHNLVVNKSLALTVIGSTTSLTVNDYTNTLGSFTPPATFNINGNTVLTAGTLTAGATINAGGNWTNNGGIFTAGAGTVNFNGIAQSIGGSSNHTFNHLTIKPTSTLTATSGIINIMGNWVNDGGFTHNNGTVTFKRTTPQTLGGANSTTFYNLIENGLAGKTTLLINTSIANDLTVTAGTLDIGLFTSNGNGGTFSVNNSATAIFLLQAAFPTGFATVNLGAASVITYSGATAQIIYPVAAPGYGYLNITNTVGATAGGNLVVQNTLTISSGAILDASNTGNYNISLGLNWTNNGGTFLQREGTVTFTGTVAQVINGTTLNQTFYHLNINKSLALTAPATLNIGGDLTLTSGTLTAGTNVFITGNMTNSGGVFTSGAGTVTFNGVTQAITGSIPITFRNITINAGSTLTGPAAMTISGQWNNSGTFVHNNGQVTFTGSTSSITSSNTTESFNNFIINKTAANLLSTAGSITSLTVNNFTQTLGNFSAPATFTINGNAVFTTGTFTAGTITNTAGNWTKATAAIFTPRTNTVNFNGSGPQTINGTSTTQTFYNVIINKAGSSLLNTSGSTATLIVNDLILTLGDFTAPAALTINGNAILTAGSLTSGTNITAKGDWTNNGGSFIPGTKTLNFTGTGAQLINGTALTQTFYNVIINKTALSLLSVGGSNTILNVNNFTQTQGDFSFVNALKINGFLTLTTGRFTSGSMLNLGGNWTNNSNFVHNNGTVILNGVVAQLIAGTSASSFNNLTISNTTAAVSVNTNSNFAGILNMNGTGSQLIPATEVVLNNAAAAGSITGNGTIRITRTTATADYLNQYKFLTNTLNNMTLNFAGVGAQTVNGALGDFGALTLSVSGAKTLPAVALNILGNITFSGTATTTALAAISVGGNVIIGAGSIFIGGAFIHNISGNWTNNGGTFTSTNSTINFRNTTSPQNINGTALTQTFFNVLLNNTAQTLSLSGGTTTLSVGGNWTNNGAVFSGGAGTVSFTGLLKSIGGTSSTDFPIISIGNGATITMNNSNTSTGLNLVSLSVNSSFTHAAGAALTVNGNVIIGQPTTSVRTNSWIINAGSASVSGLITFAGANATTSRIGRVTLTTGVLNANGGITFTASAPATKVIDMSGGAAVLNLKGALTVPVLSSTLTAGNSGSIFNYADSDPQTINFFSAGAYNNLRINNTSAGGASLSGAITTTNLMGNFFVGNINTASLFNTADFNIALNNSQGLSVYAGSVMNAGTSVISPSTLATITVDGLFKTSNTSGFSGYATAAINSANSPTILLGVASTVEYMAAAGGQPVTPLVYNNLTMSNTSGVQTLSGNVTVTKTLSLSSGTMDIGANILTLNGPAIAGTPTSLIANTASSLVLGGNTSDITIPSSITTLKNLTINNSNGVSLNSDVSLATNLLFSTGKLSTGANKLLLNAGATITGAGQSSGWINGNLQRNFSNADPGVFEIGNLSYYSPITLTLSGLSVAGNVTGSNTVSDHPNISTSGITASKSINRFWTLTNSGASFGTAAVNLNWNTADNDTGIIPANLRVAKYSSSVWSRPAVSGATTASIQANGISSLSDFIVGEIANDFSPIITSNGGGASVSLSISENNSSVTTVTATDSDVVTTLTYSISGGADAAKFNINSISGVLSFIAAPDFEVPTDADANNIYLVTVRASDGANNADQIISLTVLNVNEFSPVVTSNGGGATAAISIPENSGAVTTVVATDGDNTSPTYSISGGADAAKFNINSTTGVLDFIAAPDFEVPTDADANNIYLVTVRASDGTNNAEQTISVTVLNVNDNSPVITSNGGGATAAISIAENSSAVTTVVATDGDTTTSTFSISGGAEAAKFNINSTSGVLSFNAAPDFELPTDADANNIYLFTVQANDGTNSVIQTLTITITDLNDNKPEIVQNQVFEIEENSAKNIVVGTVLVNDKDTGTIFQSWMITSGNTGNAFEINPSSGVLSVQTQNSLQFEINPTFNLNLSVSDGLNISNSQLVKINLREFIRPTITLSATSPVCQGITTVILPYTASPGSPNTYTISWNSNAQLAGFNAVTDATLSLSPINIAVPGQAAPATYSGAIIVKNANKSSVSYPISLTILAQPLIPAISGPIEVFVNKAIQLNASVAGGLWSSSNTAIASVDPVTGLVSGKTNGNTTISYLVTNNNNCSSSSFVNLTVRTDNTAISLNWIPLQVYGNDAIGTLVGTLNLSSNNPAAIFSYSLVSGTGSTDNSLFKISGNEIRIAENLNTVQNKTFNIRVRSTDQIGISDEKVLSIKVIHINQPPVIATTANLIICSSPAPGIVNLSGINPGPESYQNVTIKLSTDNSNLFKTLSISSKNAGNAILNYTLKDGISGAATITLTLTDDGGTDNGGKDTFVSTFKITVNPAVVASINSAAGLMISKGQTVELIASGGNSYIWANADGIISGQNTDKLIVRPSQTTNYQVTVTNSFGCTATQNITLDVIEDFITLKSTNVMSPNGDGINDTWVIENIDMYPDNEVKVYDKAGRMIFQKKGYTNTWDATLNGSNLVEGTYYYYVDLGKGQKKLKGYITIVRD